MNSDDEGVEANDNQNDNSYEVKPHIVNYFHETLMSNSSVSPQQS